MPTDKDFKRLVRGRMHKTGESYTTARAKLLSRRTGGKADGRTRAVPIPVVPGSSPNPQEYARLAGMSDAAIKATTGCTWGNWVKALDYHQAYTWPHRQIAEFVRKHYNTGDWWTQTVTVGYERIKGLRVRGQQRGGSFRVNKSRTYPVSVSQLYRAWHAPATRKRWLGESKATARSGQPNKVLRLDWPDGSTVEARFTSKATRKSQVAIEHAKLPDQDSATRFKTFWTERLDALSGLLDGKGGPA